MQLEEAVCFQRGEGGYVGGESSSSAASELQEGDVVRLLEVPSVEEDDSATWTCTVERIHDSERFEVPIQSLVAYRRVAATESEASSCT